MESFRVELVEENRLKRLAFSKKRISYSTVRVNEDITVSGVEFGALFSKV